MFSLEDRPAPPVIAAFSTEMAEFLAEAARLPRPRHPHRARTAVLFSVAALLAVVGTVVAATRPGSTAPAITASPLPLGTGPVHIHLTAFSVDSSPGGTVTLTLTKDQILNPSAVRQALAQAGVPAIVNVGFLCYVAHPVSAGQFFSGHHPGPGGNTVMVITPSRMPTGTTLSIGYYQNQVQAGVQFTLVPDGVRLTCNSDPPVPAGQPTPVSNAPAS
jgi:hypothetical protein